MTARAGAHVVLVGLPGAGKSTVGSLAARLLGSPFIDLDDVIVRDAGRSIAEVFVEQGERAFRRLEHLATLAIARLPASIVAVGGGWVEDPANRDCLSTDARMVYLRASAHTAAGRLAAGASPVRPLLLGADPEAAVGVLYARRAGLYEASDATIDTEGIPPQQVAEHVRELALRWWGLLG